MKLSSTFLSCIGVATLMSCSGSRPANIGWKSGAFAPCPSSPNCVSTLATDREHGIAPLTYAGSLDDTKKKLVTVIQSLPRTKIVLDTGDYLYVQFTSATWRFVDDVEFHFDDGAKTIQFRSASRLGKSDMGVNRKRMEEISRLFRK